MTPGQLAAAAGISAQLAATWAAPLTAAMAEFAIDTPMRQAAFIAQVGHESMGFSHTREIWGPTTAQLRYEGRADLGNTHAGDGFTFRGRGLIQITGRGNYVACGQALGIDCVATPSLLEQPAFAAASAAWFWDEHGLNEMADKGWFSDITQRINGGQNGAADRLARYARALDALSTTRTDVLPLCTPELTA